MPASLFQGPQLNCVQDVIWRGADVVREILLVRCAHRPTGPCRNDFLFLTDVANYTSTKPGPKFVGYFSVLGIWLSGLTAASRLLPFVTTSSKEDQYSK